jgi:dynamin 1-like protein
VPIKEAIEIEAEFFNRHPVYSKYSTKMGIPFLTKSLNKILVAHIQRCIPDLSKQITMTI